MFRILTILFLFCGVVLGSYLIYQEFITMDVSELNSKASEYDGKPVRVKGVVEKNIAVLGVGGYLLGDGAQTILVTSDEGIPDYKSKVVVIGEFRKAVSFNGFEYNVIYQRE